jgi:GNAT superfamily N-acetyltransferase
VRTSDPPCRVPFRIDAPGTLRVMVAVRRRTTEDLPGCVHALREVHATDGYPTCWPASPSEWLSPPGWSAAWVAEQAGTVVGHVCVIRGVDDPVVAALTDAGPDRLATVSRLFVAPTARGQQLGASLLATSSSYAADEGLQLMLDVVDGGGAAVALYERLGWQLVDRRMADWTTPEGRRPSVRIYIAPTATRYRPTPR